ncbi:MAG: hypothetical protein WDZ31_05155, partial [Phycisphaeraceae bacterium]
MPETKPIEQVIRENQPRWMAVEEVEGVGIAEKDGRPAIKIFVTKITPALRNDLPLEQDGYPVLVHEESALEAENPDVDIEVHPPDPP